jgi:hypothetical protein
MSTKSTVWAWGSRRGHFNVEVYDEWWDGRLHLWVGIDKPWRYGQHWDKRCAHIDIPLWRTTDEPLNGSSTKGA